LTGINFAAADGFFENIKLATEASIPPGEFVLAARFEVVYEIS
jgi:hypothetical protein